MDKELLNQALYASSVNGKLDALKYLINKGADINYVSKIGFNVIIAAISNWNFKIVEELLKHNNLDLKFETAMGTDAYMFLERAYKESKRWDDAAHGQRTEYIKELCDEMRRKLNA